MEQERRANVLIVDDELGPRESLGMILKPSFNIYSSEDGREAIQIIKNTNIDVVTLDIKMPIMSGEEVLKVIKDYDPTIEVVIITGYGTLKSAVEAIKYNVFDYILKPFNVSDILATVKRCLERREMSLRVKEFLMAVEKESKSPLKMYKHISQFLNKLDEFYHPAKSEGYLEFVKVLTTTLESNDLSMKGHSDRVNYYATLMAEGLKLSQADTRDLQTSAYLHDIGNVGMIVKNGSTGEKERMERRDHPLKGAKMVAPLKLSPEVINGIKYHHERMDGTGFPEGLKGDQIPLFARIIAIADHYDALTMDRPDKKTQSKHAALAELKKNVGSQFDAKLVDIFAKEQRNK
ncbi:MAG: response regulator [Deltaproteobacteria bacterium]|nr:response regulator [Deltaproteobacteria bacterium]